MQIKDFYSLVLGHQESEVKTEKSVSTNQFKPPEWSKFGRPTKKYIHTEEPHKPNNHMYASFKVQSTS